MSNPNAYYDCLAICSRLEKNLGNTIVPEIHLFAYLACMLSLFKETPISMWGYSFSVTTTSYPFSVDIDEEIMTLISGNCLVNENESLKLTELGKERYQLLKGFSQYIDREPFLEGSCSTILALPIGFVRKAISHETGISYALALQQNSLLLGEGAINDIYQQFKTLSSIIGIDTQEMIVPAVLWLTCISSSE